MRHHPIRHISGRVRTSEGQMKRQGTVILLADAHVTILDDEKVQ